MTILFAESGSVQAAAAMDTLSSMSQHRTRIMYVEAKGAGLNGPARIGRVTYSKSGRSLSYAGRTFESLGGSGFKANYFDVETGEHYWISGPRKDGRDRLYEASTRPVEVNADVADEYWTMIRGRLGPERNVG